MRRAGTRWLSWLVVCAGCDPVTWPFGPVADAAVQAPVDAESSNLPPDAAGDDSRGNGFCDGAACYGCVTNGDCPWTGLVCVASRCVASCGDGGCPPGEQCIVPGDDAGCQDSCAAGVCGECTKDTDCTNDPNGSSGHRTLCDPVHYRCVECLSDANCPGACDVPSGTCISMRDD